MLSQMSPRFSPCPTRWWMVASVVRYEVILWRFWSAWKGNWIPLMVSRQHECQRILLFLLLISFIFSSNPWELMVGVYMPTQTRVDRFGKHMQVIWFYRIWGFRDTVIQALQETPVVLSIQFTLVACVKYWNYLRLEAKCQINILDLRIERGLVGL